MRLCWSTDRGNSVPLWATFKSQFQPQQLKVISSNDPFHPVLNHRRMEKSAAWNHLSVVWLKIVLFDAWMRFFIVAILATVKKHMTGLNGRQLEQLENKMRCTLTAGAHVFPETTLLERRSTLRKQQVPRCASSWLTWKTRFVWWFSLFRCTTSKQHFCKIV